MSFRRRTACGWRGWGERTRRSSSRRSRACRTGRRRSSPSSRRTLRLCTDPQRCMGPRRHRWCRRPRWYGNSRSPCCSRRWCTHWRRCSPASRPRRSGLRHRRCQRPSKHCRPGRGRPKRRSGRCMPRRYMNRSPGSRSRATHCTARPSKDCRHRARRCTRRRTAPCARRRRRSLLSSCPGRRTPVRASDRHRSEAEARRRRGTTRRSVPSNRMHPPKYRRSNRCTRCQLAPRGSCSCRPRKRQRSGIAALLRR